MASILFFAAAPSASAQNCQKRFGAKHTKAFASKVWHTGKWERGKPPKRMLKLYRYKLLHCAASIKHRRVSRKVWQRHVKRYFEHKAHKEEERRKQAEIDALTPYDCGSAGRWAIPCYIVECESGYSWSAYNPSGAAGPYQIMPMWGRPWPIYSDYDKAEHHRIAASIWNGGAGASNWVCA